MTTVLSAMTTRIKLLNFSLSAILYTAGMCSRTIFRTPSRDLLVLQVFPISSMASPSLSSGLPPASIRLFSRSASIWSTIFCSALHVCRLVTTTADSSCITKNAPTQTISAYHSSTGQPMASISVYAVSFHPSIVSP